MIVRLVCIGFVVIILSTRDWHLVFGRAENRQIVNQLGLFGYTLYDVGSLIGSMTEWARINSVNTEPYAEFLSKQSDHRGDSHLKERKRKNVIFLQMESVDGFCLWADFEGDPLMPRLREIASKGVAFSNTLDVTHAGRTADAELLALTSLVPVQGNPVFVSYDLGRAPSLPRVLNDAGYYTFSAHGYEGFFWNRAKAHQSLGYDRDFFKPDIPSSEVVGWGIPDEQVLGFALDEIRGADGSVFAHIILLTHHHPYNYVGDRFGDRKDSIEKDYIVSLRYVDKQIGKFYDSLNESGELENTILAIYGDHDSGITVPLAEHLGVKLAPLGDTVPLVIHGLDTEPRVEKGVVGLQDLPVIVLHDLGIRPPETFVGNSLSSVGRTISFDGSVWQLQGQNLVVSPFPLDLRKLTKLSVLRPKELEREN